MPNPNKAKGSRGETDVVKTLRDKWGLTAWKTARSGAGEFYKGDIRVKLGEKVLEGECKVSEKRWKREYDEKSTHDILFIRRIEAGANQFNKKAKPFLAVIEIDLLADLIRQASMPKESS